MKKERTLCKDSLVPALVTFTAIGLTIAGLVIPPPGVIDPSVLTAVGELLAFKALSMLPQLIRKKGSATLSVGNTTVAVSGHNADTNTDDEDDDDPC